MELDRAVGIVGWSGVGKTTLIERLIPVFALRGLRVSTIKHCHHDLAIDVPGKDTDRHQQAGAFQTLLVSDSGTVLFQRAREIRPSLGDMLAAMAEVDLVLVEGFRSGQLARVEVWSANADRPPQALHDRSIAALISDVAPGDEFDRPVFGRNDLAAIAKFLAGLRGAALPWCSAASLWRR
jgi:molybdopterin-guanine dinucleotide biosynthesis protein B